MTFINGQDNAEPPAYPERMPTTRHEYYYFEEGNLVIQVYETLFKIWDGPFRRNSKFFEKTAPVAMEVNKVKVGSDDTCPWVLRDVQSAEFERLLWILYPRVIGEFEAKSSQDWITILELSTRYGFKDVRELAIKELGKLSLEPIDKVELLVRYNIKHQWAYSAFIAICSRQHALDVVEGRQLGIEMTVQIAFAREKLEKWGRKKPEEVKKVVCEVFEVKEE